MWWGRWRSTTQGVVNFLKLTKKDQEHPTGIPLNRRIEFFTERSIFTCWRADHQRHRHLCLYERTG